MDRYTETWAAQFEAIRQEIESNLKTETDRQRELGLFICPPVTTPTTLPLPSVVSPLGGLKPSATNHQPKIWFGPSSSSSTAATRATILPAADLQRPRISHHTGPIVLTDMLKSQDPMTQRPTPGDEKIGGDAAADTSSSSEVAEASLRQKSDEEVVGRVAADRVGDFHAPVALASGGSGGARPIVDGLGFGPLGGLSLTAPTTSSPTNPSVYRSSMAETQLKWLHTEMLSIVQKEMNVLRQQVKDQVAAFWKAKLQELDFVLRERFSSLQEIYDSNRVVVLEVGNSVVGFKKEIATSVMNYNQHLQKIVENLKSFIKEEIEKVYELSSILQTEIQAVVRKTEDENRTIRTSVAKDVSTLQSTIDETVDSLKKNVQLRISKLDDQVLAILDTKTGLNAVQQQLHSAEIANSIEPRLNFLEGEMARMTALLFQSVEKQTKESQRMDEWTRVTSQDLAAAKAFVSRETENATKNEEQNHRVDQLSAQIQRVQNDLVRLEDESKKTALLALRLSEAKPPPPPIRVEEKDHPEDSARQKMVHEYCEDVKKLVSRVNDLQSKFSATTVGAVNVTAENKIVELSIRYDQMEKDIAVLKARIPNRRSVDASLSQSQQSIDPSIDLPANVQNYVDDQISTVTTELSELSHTVRRKIEPRVDQLMLHTGLATA